MHAPNKYSNQILIGIVCNIGLICLSMLQGIFVQIPNPFIWLGLPLKKIGFTLVGLALIIPSILQMKKILADHPKIQPYINIMMVLVILRSMVFLLNISFQLESLAYLFFIIAGTAFDIVFIVHLFRKFYRSVPEIKAFRPIFISHLAMEVFSILIYVLSTLAVMFVLMDRGFSHVDMMMKWVSTAVYFAWSIPYIMTLLFFIRIKKINENAQEVKEEHWLTEKPTE